MQKQINTTNWEAEFNEKFVLPKVISADYTASSDYKREKFSDSINVFVKASEIKQFIKDLLASSQKDKEKEIEEVVNLARLAFGKNHQNWKEFKKSVNLSLKSNERSK